MARSDGEGRGSEFIVRLPLARSSAPVADAAQPAASLRAIRILVVDDNEDAASTLGALLEALGAEVDVVNDGRSALDTFAAKDQSVILLDIGMPEMDGYEVAAILRARFPQRRPKIIALTGWGQSEDRRKALEAQPALLGRPWSDQSRSVMGRRRRGRHRAPLQGPWAGGPRSTR